MPLLVDGAAVLRRYRGGLVNIDARRHIRLGASMGSVSLPFAFLVAFVLLLLAAGGLYAARRLRRAWGNLVRQVSALDGRLEVLGTAVGTLARSVELGQRSLGQAVGQFSNDTASRLEAIKAGVNAEALALKRIDEHAQDIRTALALVQSAVWGNFVAEFMTPCDWTPVLTAAMRSRPEPLAAEEFLRARQTFSKPVDLRCSDGNVYVVKPQQQGLPERRRRLFTDCVVTRLGKMIGAPVLEHALVSIPVALIARHGEAMAHILPGVAAGSRYHEALGPRRDEILHAQSNRQRFAAIAILHAWARTYDRHMHYEATPPFRVYSLDHDGYFVGGPYWGIEDLRQSALARPAEDILDACRLTHDDLAVAVAPLQLVGPQEIAEAVALPPDEWGVSMEERVAVCKYLRLRQFHLLALYGPTKSVSHLRARAAE